MSCFRLQYLTSAIFRHLSEQFQGWAVPYSNRGLPSLGIHRVCHPPSIPAHICVLNHVDAATKSCPKIPSHDSKPVGTLCHPFGPNFAMPAFVPCVSLSSWCVVPALNSDAIQKLVCHSCISCIAVWTSWRYRVRCLYPLLGMPFCIPHQDLACCPSVRAANPDDSSHPHRNSISVISRWMESPFLRTRTLDLRQSSASNGFKADGLSFFPTPMLKDASSTWVLNVPPTINNVSGSTAACPLVVFRHRTRTFPMPTSPCRSHLWFTYVSANNQTASLTLP